ncbi:Ti-type conjugative transfer relaxase TraA [Devosia sp. Naph2]|uniref:Ti-type conjugative transfer relaxase TraA n=1 Tax=Devosia polycyclovorans TaxID=3345148 RepID=UPI0035CFEE9E
MAITHFTPQIISRAEGRSVVAAAAYRHCARMEIEREGRSADFSNKPDLAHAEFSVPVDAPAWVKTIVTDLRPAQCSETFWNRLEAFEKRADAQLAKEFILALPVELTIDQNVALMRDFVDAEITARGLVADWVLHDAKGNPHVHLMTSLRPLTVEGFGAKRIAVLDEDGRPVRSPAGQIRYQLWAGDKADFLKLRDAWYGTQNRHLAQHGYDVRVDGRSYAERGVDLEPTPHIGVGAKAIQRAADAEGRIVDLDRLAQHEAARRENASRITRRPELVLEAIASEKSVFDKRDIARYLHRYVDDASQFAAIMARILASDALLLIEAESFDPVSGQTLPARYATREMVRIEAEMADRAVVLAAGRGFGISASSRKEVLAAESRLSDEQGIAIEHITGPERLGIVVGRAGAGKTTMMKAAREVWAANGYAVIGGALAGKAAEGLQQEAGIGSRTLASWQLHWGRGEDLLHDKSIFVLDEAGMVSSRQMAALIDEVARAGAKLILVGDAEQLQPIEAGGAFRTLAERLGYAELGTIFRQHETWMRQASMDLACGDVSKALSQYHTRGHVVETKCRVEAMTALVADWIADYDPDHSSLMLAYLRRDVRALNDRAREALQARGIIGAGAEFETEDGARRFAPGDRIVFLRNERSIGVMNGTIGRVVTSEKGHLIAEIGTGGWRVEIDQRFYRDLDHGYATTIHKSQGTTVDSVRVLASPQFDRHLAYVALTRHRKSVTLYAAADDFRSRTRIDHVSGVTGELIDAGLARFGDDPKSKPGPYADLRDRDGVVHRLWGAGLPEAITQATVAIGDIVTLSRNGIEDITVKVPFVDQATGKTRFEERAVERSTWSAVLVSERDAHEPHRDAGALFGSPGRIDHAAGVTGELIGQGEAPYREDNKGSSCPYADLRLPNHATHRLWGKDVPHAIAKADAAIGDTITLHRLAPDDVAVQSHRSDFQGGLLIGPNVWTCALVETATERSARHAAATTPKPSTLLPQLINRFSRSGAKTTTLDFAGSEVYRQAHAYATNRGLAGLRVITAMAKNHARWIADQRHKLLAASTRLASFVAQLAPTVVKDKTQTMIHPTQAPLLSGVSVWSQTIKEAVEARMQNDATLSLHWANVQDRLQLVYDKPEATIEAINLAGTNKGDGTNPSVQAQILAQLESTPEAFGAMRGRTGLMASPADRADRQAARDNLVALKKGLQNYWRLKTEIGAARTSEVGQQRERQKLDIPAISSAAESVLERIRDALDRNDLSAAMGFVLADKLVKTEIDQLNDRLEAKFGKRAFMTNPQPHGKEFERVSAKVARADHAKLTRVWPLLRAAQTIAAEERVQMQGQNRTMARDQGVSR